MEVTATTTLIAASSLALVILLYKLLFRASNYWKSRGIPCLPGTMPFCGNTFTVLRLKDNMATWSRRVYQENRGSASMIGFFNMSTPTVMILDPELVKIVLQTGFKAFQDNEHTVDPKLDPLLAGDAFFLRGQAWRDCRAVFSPAFSIKRIKLMSEAVERACEKMRNYLSLRIANKQTRDAAGSLELEAKYLFSQYTTEVAAGTIFSIDGHSFEVDTSNTLFDAIRVWFGPSTNNAITFLLSLSPFAKYVRTSFVPPTMDVYFRRMVKDVEELKKRNEIASNDVLRMMLDLVKDRKISRDEALAHAFTFLIESYETSSLTLSFTAYLLAKNPEIQEKTRLEIQTVLTKYEGRLTYDAIQELNYTERVINETMRLFPPLGYLAKVAVERYRLEGSDGLSLIVEPGTSILIPVMGLHEDPEIWENPDVFDPERFTKENVERRHKYAYLPFGDGPRACPGMRLALTQVKAAIATVLRDYRIDLSPKMIDPLRIEPAYFLNTARGGFLIKLTPLTHH